MCDEKIVLVEDTHDIQVVGKLKQEYIDILKLSLPCADIYMYPGAIKHLKKKHNEDFKKYFHIFCFLFYYIMLSLITSLRSVWP